MGEAVRLYRERSASIVIEDKLAVRIPGNLKCGG